MSYIEGSMIQSLQKLLRTDEDDEKNFGSTSPTRMWGPGDIGKKEQSTKNVTPWRNDTSNDPPKTSQPSAAPKNLEEFEELDPNHQKYNDHKRPDYRYIYRQAVGTEDIFFRLNNRNNSTASCEDIILEIDLAGDKTPLHQMTLDITEQNVSLITRVYYLHLPLVQTINVQRSSAKYDADKQIMRIKMRAVREMDICNF